MNKKIPVIKAIIGNLTYYTGVLSFEDISKYVNPINDELYKSKSLSDAIQRSITDNYLSIKEYILNQEERFFNAIVLAVYDGNPNWIEVELEVEGEAFYNMGFLSLSGEEKIFPVDGQHRVEGIKTALSENSELKNEKVPVIFIGHKKTDEGMKKTRRLFSTLNRYAKPVSPKDIVALDEDDIVAITTRYIVENHPLFERERVVFSLQKGINSTNKKAFTSLITLSDCIDELFKYYFTFYKKTDDFKEYLIKYFPEKKSIGVKAFKRFRPAEQTINDFEQFVNRYWDAVSTLGDIKNYMNNESDQPVLAYRTKETGGNILFRPIGILPFIQATVSNAKLYSEINNTDDIDFNTIIDDFRDINFLLNEKPWIHIAWDPHTQNMKTTGNRKLIKLLFLYHANIEDTSLLSEKDLDYIKVHYASFVGYDGNIEQITLDMLLDL